MTTKVSIWSCGSSKPIECRFPFDFAKALVMLSDPDHISSPNCENVTSLGLYSKFRDIMSPDFFLVSHMPIVEAWNRMRLAYSITDKPKKYLAFLQANSNKILVHFDTLDFLSGICSLLLWTNKLDNMLDLVCTETSLKYKVRITDNENNRHIDCQKHAIQEELVNTIRIDDLVNVILQYIISKCDRRNNMIECCNYHDNYDTLCNNCMGKCLDRYPTITAELI